jgi:hypothetical protein
VGGAEAGQPLVVDAHHLDGGFRILEAIAGAEDAVQHLGLNAVARLILQPQIGVGQTANPPAAVVVETGRRHAIGAVDLPRHVLAAGRAHPVHQPELAALLRHPDRALGSVGDERHAVTHGRGGIRGEEIGRQPRQIDVAVGGDDLIVHVAGLL